MSKAAALLCMLLLAGCAVQNPTMPQRPRITAADGTRIAYSYWQGGSTGVILLHMLDRDRHDYDDLAKRLNSNGFSVLSIDLRGHGESGGRPWRQMSENEFRKMLLDAEAAAEFLVDHGVTELMVVGASIGANVALQLAKTHARMSRAVLLSPGRTYRGVRADASGMPVPLLVVASEDDQYSAESSRSLIEQAGSQATLVMYDTAGHGTRMFGPEPHLPDRIVAWLEGRP